MAIGNDLEIYLREHEERKIPLGIRCIDDLTNGGLPNGQMALIAGITGHGKSSIAEQIALDVSQNELVDYYPLENGKEDTLMHCGAKIAKCSVDIFRKCGLDSITQSELNNRSLIVNDTDNARTSMRKLTTSIKKNRASLIIIDHTRHIDEWLRGNAPYKAAEITQDLVMLARELDTRIILCAQINWKGMQYGRKRPTLADVHDTSALVQLASLAIVVYRPFYGTNRDDIVEYGVGKNRMGRAKLLHNRWVGETTTAYDVADDDQNFIRCCLPKTKKIGR